jgi:hypothetical protein
MFTAIKGAGVGLILGMTAGFILAMAIDRTRPLPPSGWTSYPTVASETTPQGPVLLQQHIRADLLDLRTLAFFGLLFGGASVRWPGPLRALRPPLSQRSGTDGRQPLLSSRATRYLNNTSRRASCPG